MNYRLEASLGYATRLASRCIGKRLQELFHQHGYSINTYEWMVLIVLYHKDGQNQQALANQCGKDKAGITRIIDALEYQGFLVRRPDPNDRRSNLVFTTPEGRSVTEKLAEFAQQSLREATEGVSESDLATAMAVLQKVRTNLD